VKGSRMGHRFRLDVSIERLAGVLFRIYVGLVR
jgi:hypothetical protein